jgi:hypothetical protein
VPIADPLPEPSALADGRLDEIAARYGVTIAKVRRTTMGHRYLGRPRRRPDVDEVVRR